MKKLMLITLFILLMVGLMSAQTFVPTTDVLGAHNDGGRGCAGCHAPHSGGRGNGGDIVGTGTAAPTGTAEGDYHLWGQDLWAITAANLSFGGGYDKGAAGYTVSFTQGEWTSGSLPVIGGIAACLSCHDGNVSKGAMMLNQSYEQAAGLLPNGGGKFATTGALYGTTPIPTLLGADGGTAGDYLNDHPVGPQANFNGLSYPQPLQNYGLTFTYGSGWNGPSATFTATGAYAQFVQNYGAPAMGAMVVDATNQVPYVVCTTCHNQHQMNVYISAGNTTTGFGDIKLAGTYATYFFVNSPYNPGAKWTTTAAPSTTQFCRQCHFGEANEAFGVNGIATAF